jgi:hypothetical protein
MVYPYSMQACISAGAKVKVCLHVQDLLVLLAASGIRRLILKRGRMFIAAGT